MESRAKGLLAIWTDVEPSAQAEFAQWYDREHLAERAGIEGFLNARRYAAVRGAPQFFAAYDTRDLAVLGSPVYVEALGNQTEWSRRMFTHFRHTTRLIAAQTADRMLGIGGAMLTLRLEPGAAGPRVLAERLGHELVEPVAALPGIVRVTVALGVLAGLESDPTRPARLAAEQPDAVALLVEGAEPAALEQAQGGPLSEPALRHAGATSVVQMGLYRMLCTVLG